MDSNFQSIRDSTQLIYDVITGLNYQLQEFPIRNSESKVNDFMITGGNANRVKIIINKYCRFMSRPGFKVWNIAGSAKTEEMINTDNYIPFEEYHFKETDALEAEIILSNLLNEVLNVESRYYTFKLRNEVCN
ncbi:MAG: hypothetical protein MJA30_14070 [Cytophagales bacterium]|nr:hypothetical protein [Cytophagales bacterium]